MATLEYWIQLENRPWDLCPSGIDRMTGQTIKTLEGTNAVNVTLVSAVGGPTLTRTMFKPLRKDGKIVDALIYRRYKPPILANQSDAWTVPDDRKVNPWDLNEPLPDETGTMGTIPGPVIEAKVGDDLKIHFRNRDHRVDASGMPIAIEYRCHSMHPHGVVFKAAFDGAYPLSPPDSAQPVAGSPGPNETAKWTAVPGFTGSSKKGDRVPPDGTFTYVWSTEGWASTAGVWLYHDHSICDMDNVERGAIGIIVIHNPLDTDNEVDIRDPIDPTRFDTTQLPGGSPTGSPVDPRTTTSGNRLYRPPPTKLQALQLFHSLVGSSTCINGRQYLGNTPTIVAGTSTLMRFGVVGMGSEFHTFHIHGHRWVTPGPDGNTPGTIQGNVQNMAISQFEDTRTFGPANSFVFTINGASGSFMRAGGRIPDDSLGEWHMHCHVLMHMMMGMMGSLLIVKGGQIVTQLPRGVPLPTDNTVRVIDFTYVPQTITVSMGTTVQWVWAANQHSVTSNTGVNPSFDSGVLNTGFTWSQTFNTMGTFPYHCSVHGTSMAGTVIVTM